MIESDHAVTQTPTRRAIGRGVREVRNAECGVRSERRKGTAFNAEDAENAEGDWGNKSSAECEVRSAE